MIIDFHTHMFPEKIADKTISFLAAVCHEEPQTDGTYLGLADSTRQAGIDLSIALPVVTKPSQFDSINKFASQYRKKPILSFGSIHPDSEDYKGQLIQLKEMGFLGIKLHPDYQDTFFNDIRYKRIVSYATELDLIISVHAGVDPKSPQAVHCTPAMSAELIKEVQPKKLILAHLGGNEQVDEVKKYLLGENVYFDTAHIVDKVEKNILIEVIRAHGAEKILFATDTPWGNQKKFVDIIKNLDITNEEREKIFYKNACKLLHL